MQATIDTTRNYHALAQLNETVQSWHHRQYPDEFKPFDRQAVEGVFQNLLEKDNTLALLATHQDQPVGYLLAFIKERPDSPFQYKKTVLYLDQIAVLPAYQKTGVGQRLMDHALAFANESGISEVQLDFWEGNQSAERFFRNNGFTSFNYRMKKVRTL